MNNKVMLFASTLILTSTGWLAAAEIQGQVVDVQGDTVRVVSQSDLLPNPGDPIQIYFELEGIDLVADAGTGKVTSVEGTVILARITSGVGRARVGYLAKITSDNATTKDGTQQRKQLESVGVSREAAIAALEGLDARFDPKNGKVMRVELSFVSLKGRTNSLAHLKAFPEMQSLALVKTDLDDDALAHIKRLDNLVLLFLGLNPIADNGLVHLRELKKLQVLDLAFTEMTDQGLRHLSGLTDLRDLDISGAKVTDVGLEELGGLKHLQSLCLHRTEVTDAGLRQLTGLTKLRALDLTGTKVTDAGLKHLAGFADLRWLELGDTQVTDAGLEELAKFKSLQKLTLQRAQVTAEGVVELRRLRPDLEVVLGIDSKDGPQDMVDIPQRVAGGPSGAQTSGQTSGLAETPESTAAPVPVRVQLSPQQRKTVQLLGDPDTFLLFFLRNDETGDTTRLETWRYYGYRTSFTFVDGTFSKSHPVDPLPSNALIPTYRPGDFDSAMTSAEVQSYFQGSQLVEVALDDLELGGEFPKGIKLLSAPMVMLGLQNDRLAYVQSILLVAGTPIVEEE